MAGCCMDAPQRGLDGEAGLSVAPCSSYSDGTCGSMTAAGMCATWAVCPRAPRRAVPVASPGRVSGRHARLPAACAVSPQRAERGREVADERPVGPPRPGKPLGLSPLPSPSRGLETRPRVAYRYARRLSSRAYAADMTRPHGRPALT